jgi:hypothetical protein
MASISPYTRMDADRKSNIEKNKRKKPKKSLTKENGTFLTTQYKEDRYTITKITCRNIISGTLFPAILNMNSRIAPTWKEA